MCFKTFIQQNDFFLFCCDKKITSISHNLFICAVICLLLQSCTTDKIDLQTPADYKEQIIFTKSFQIYSLQKLTAQNLPVVFYIEGDGKSWITEHQLSTDPTPVSTLVRGLAFKDTRPNIVYLARPCQYIGTFDSPCKTRDFGEYWSEKRFAPEVIASMNDAINQVKNKMQARKIILISYSGGGAVAALLAAQRTDIAQLITIAGNLDIQLHSRIHGVSALTGSLNPLDYASQIHVSQIHYIGGKDDNVPIDITKSFISALPKDTDVKIIPVSNATHQDGWDNIDLTR